MEYFPWLDAGDSLARLENQEKCVKTVDDLSPGVAQDRDFGVSINVTRRVNIVELVRVVLELFR